MADPALGRRVLALVQGHPKLLELADAAAADPARLAAQLAAAEAAVYGASLRAFLTVRGTPRWTLPSDYAPLLGLGRLGEAEQLLRDCQHAFDTAADIPMLGMVYTAATHLPAGRSTTAIKNFITSYNEDCQLFAWTSHHQQNNEPPPHGIR